MSMFANNEMSLSICNKDKFNSGTNIAILILNMVSALKSAIYLFS